MSAQEYPTLSGQPSDAEINQFLEQLLGGDLPGEGFLFPDSKTLDEPRVVPDVQQVRDELLRAIRNMAVALQMPYSEEKKADLGHALLSSSQSYLLLDPSLDTEGLPAEGPGSKAHAQALATHEFPPRVQPNAAEERLNEKTKPKQEALKHDRGQSPLPRPRANG